MTFNPTLPVQTRDGREAEIFATDMGGEYSILGRYRRDTVNWVPATWNNAGQSRRGHENSIDLINIPKTHKLTVLLVRWVHDGPVTATIAENWPNLNHGLLASKVIEITEGEGL